MAPPQHTVLPRTRHCLRPLRRRPRPLPHSPPKDGCLQFSPFVSTRRGMLTISSPAYDDGRTQLLLCLHGLLPIAYRGASYNIPIAIWLTREYPRQPPIAYVVPTTDMIVRPGPDMDVSGRCQLEYLRNWQRKSEVRARVLITQLVHCSCQPDPPNTI